MERSHLPPGPHGCAPAHRSSFTRPTTVSSAYPLSTAYASGTMPETGGTAPPSPRRRRHPARRHRAPRLPGLLRRGGGRPALSCTSTPRGLVTGRVRSARGPARRRTPKFKRTPLRSTVSQPWSCTGTRTAVSRKAATASEKRCCRSSAVMRLPSGPTGVRGARARQVVLGVGRDQGVPGLVRGGPAAEWAPREEPRLAARNRPQSRNR